MIILKMIVIAIGALIAIFLFGIFLIMGIGDPKEYSAEMKKLYEEANKRHRKTHSKGG